MRGVGERDKGRERELNTSSSGQPMVAQHDAWFTKLGFLASVMINHAKIFPLQCIRYAQTARTIQVFLLFVGTTVNNYVVPLIRPLTTSTEKTINKTDTEVSLAL